MYLIFIDYKKKKWDKNYINNIKKSYKKGYNKI